MKFAVLLTAIAAIALAGCLPGQRLGNFKNWCDQQGGTYVKSDKNPTDYMCTLPSGDKIYSK
jgi:hypothetical protein